MRRGLVTTATIRTDFGPASGLVCRECGTTYEIGPLHACAECFGPLEIAYDDDALRRVTRESIAAGPTNLWRYAGLLPLPTGAYDAPNLGAGLTRLHRADNLARAIGMKPGVLWVKDDSGNPTHSFKDRVVTVATAAARALGFTTIACASTGNLANAVAAAAARAGMRSCVFIPHDLEHAKVVQTAVYDGTLVAIDGNY